MGGLLIGNNNNIAVKPRKIFGGVQGSAVGLQASAVAAKAVFVGDENNKAVKVFHEGGAGGTYTVNWSVVPPLRGWFWAIDIGDTGTHASASGSVTPSTAGGYSVFITAAQNPYDPSGIPEGGVDIAWIVKDAWGNEIQQGDVSYTTDAHFELQTGYDVYNIEIYV